ncbi:MAG: hypothetical protein GOMPHAMPRED_003822 [Gomphillus americanus]|uniref:Uncharacterized protein n=1 Tax=Gomphillus americanus TaxID=1940652 RepID=A0A8H3IN56_9LECA|nr:MAG: hypothetical protein GOMPHAMPRED_003822 [Gomphillus americanus]
MSSDNTIPVVPSHSLRSSSKLDARAASRHTVFTTSPSQHLSPFESRSSPSPPASPFPAISRSSSLRSARSPSRIQDEVLAFTTTDTNKTQNRPSVTEALSKSTSIESQVELRQPIIRTPMDSSDKEASLRPRPSPLHPRRRSWFREEDPSAFGPPSPDPAALSPMATFRSSMSEDEQRDELFSESFSDLSRPPSSSSLSPAVPYSFRQHQELEQGNRSSSTTQNDRNLLALPSRTRSGSTRSYQSNPAVVINPAKDDPEIPRRASDGDGPESTKNTSSEAGSERVSSLVSGPRSQKRSVWERALKRGGGMEETGSSQYQSRAGL